MGLLSLIKNIYNNNRFEQSYGFEDVAIKQQKNICVSRLDSNISSEVIRGINRPIPLIASNMSTVVNADFCIRLYELGALGFMHRALPEDKYLQEIDKIASRCDLVCASVGIGDDQFILAQKLIRHGANVIVIDIAHGFSDFVVEMAKKIKSFSKDTKVVIGNTINVQSAYEVDKYADALKIGIAQGSGCETFMMTGCTEKQFSAVLKFKKVSRKLGLPIVSDGGIKIPSDVVKAIGAGATSVMAGQVFARCPESAATEFEVEGVKKKIYAGMSSRYVQEMWRGGLKPGTCVEGKTLYLDMGEPLENLLERYGGAIRSGLTYSGSNNIKDFQKKCKFILIK